MKHKTQLWKKINFRRKEKGKFWSGNLFIYFIFVENGKRKERKKSPAEWSVAFQKAPSFHYFRSPHLSFRSPKLSFWVYLFLILSLIN